MLFLYAHWSTKCWQLLANYYWWSPNYVSMGHLTLALNRWIVHRRTYIVCIVHAYSKWVDVNPDLSTLQILPQDHCSNDIVNLINRDKMISESSQLLCIYKFDDYPTTCSILLMPDVNPPILGHYRLPLDTAVMTLSNSVELKWSLKVYNCYANGRLLSHNLLNDIPQCNCIIILQLCNFVFLFVLCKFIHL